MRPGNPLLLAALLVTLALGCDESATDPEPGDDVDPHPAPAGVVPLTEMGSRTYLGFQGGLYPGGLNTIPVAHFAAGMAAAAAMQPLDSEGRPSPAGKVVLLSIGMSNTTQEFCSAGGRLACEPWTFMGRAAADPEVNDVSLAIVNGARGGQDASAWDAPDEREYARIRDEVLAPRGLGEAQVQVAWVKVANARPAASLPGPDADAYRLEAQMGDIARALKARYANLRLAFFSSRIYGGYATTTLNPEPYAFESGLAVKWLVESQIEQTAGGAADSLAGDLTIGTAAPWIGWGPYLWADGRIARSDGLTWEPADFQSDGTHPSQSGEAKVGTLLLEFFKSLPLTSCWFLEGESCT